MRAQAVDLTSHRADAQMEDAEFILAHGGSMEEAAERTGVSMEAMERRTIRRAKRESAA